MRAIVAAPRVGHPSFHRRLKDQWGPKLIAWSAFACDPLVHTLTTTQIHLWWGELKRRCQPGERVCRTIVCRLCNLGPCSVLVQVIFQIIFSHIVQTDITKKVQIFSDSPTPTIPQEIDTSNPNFALNAIRLQSFHSRSYQ